MSQPKWAQSEPPERPEGSSPGWKDSEAATGGPSWIPSTDDQFRPKDYYDFERKDADRIKGWRHPGSGNGDWYKLDSRAEDYLTDNKVVGLKSDRKSFSIHREQWRHDREHAREVHKQLRMSVLFIDRHVPEGHPDRELHVVVIEGGDFQDKYEDALVLRRLLELHPELQSEAAAILREI